MGDLGGPWNELIDEGHFSMIEQIIEAILETGDNRAQMARIVALSQSIPDFSDREVDELLVRILDLVGDGSGEYGGPNTLDSLIQPVISKFVQRETTIKDGEENEDDDQVQEWSESRFENVQAIYERTPVDSDLRNHLLRWLATEGSGRAIEVWTDLVCDDPPGHQLGIVLAFAPLMQPDFRPPARMLSKLANHGTGNSRVAPAIFDLFNYYFRQKRVETHPAIERIDVLTELLGQLVGQLGRIEEGDFPDDFSAGKINQLVSDSVALIVSLCDTFALVDHQPAIGKLHQALKLRHRRVQTEAAATLARLGDDMGKQALIELAAQPVSRFRVLAYAEELGFLNEISLELRGEIALAESQLAIWLAEPEQMGLAPSSIEFLESRELIWPGYEHPIQCYLFQYTFGAGEQAHSNIGICGPMTHAFAADLRHLGHDDIFAMFAGWQTVHEEIFQMSIAQAESAFSNEWRRLTGDLKAMYFEATEMRMVGSFFGDLVLISDATREKETGTAIVDSRTTSWYSHGNPDAAVDWQLAYAIWRGHQLLNSFNESESA